MFLSAKQQQKVVKAGVASALAGVVVLMADPGFAADLPGNDSDGIPAGNPVVAEKAAPEKRGPESVNYQEVVRQTLPVAYWSFDGGGPGLGKVVGDVAFEKEGPTVENSKTFMDGNRAAAFGKEGGTVRLKDVGPGSQFDFDNGDPITIEAWVKPEAGGGLMAILGKGRTHNEGVSRDNQNYVFRLENSDGALRLGFLFRSRGEEKKAGDWHRWSSVGSLVADGDWHHVAVSYVFGNPKSIVGYIDGEPVTGTWDMGGETTQAPVVDDDEIWVGGAQAGAERARYRGLLDEVALYRRVLSEDQIAMRCETPPYLPVVDESKVVPGKVRVEIVENLGAGGRWPRRFDEPTEVYTEDAFGFSQVPQKYTETGARADWGNPFLLRAIAKVALKKGENRVLLRTRGGGRLWMDGVEVAETGFPNTDGGGHNEVAEIPESLSANLRRIAMGDREEVVTIAGDGKEHVCVLERIAGNGKVRPTLGETTVSVSHGGSDFALLSPEREVLLTESGWQEYRREREDRLRTLDAERRREVREAGEANYWAKRHEWARAVVEKRGTPAVPLGEMILADFPVGNEIDRFLAASWSKTRREQAAREAAGGIDFEKEIKPILADQCFRCHANKAKGGLRLDSREAALKGGDSEVAAVVPGDPEKSLLMEMIDPKLAGDDVMPPKGDPLSEEQREVFAHWIAQGAVWSEGSVEIVLTESTNDLEFLRRVTLDTTGVVPSADEIEAFLNDMSANRRAVAIDRLLEDDRWADHWVSYWQDVLAENPNILKPSLNNSGPFRFWIYEALQDNLPFDQFVTDLVMMKGSATGGGAAGFGLAAENDVPMAAKAHILGTAFLGVEMKCARCHDSPYHSSVQKDLFQVAAMLEREAIILHESSTVPATTFAGREPLIPITLKPGDRIEPGWPFAEFALEAPEDWVVRERGDTREQLAAYLTSPHNDRFAEVIVNRVWKRLMGAGFVDPVDDWEASPPVYPELLSWLAGEFVTSGYDLKALARTIMNSDAYQRKAVPLGAGEAPSFAAPVQRRMGAEQVVDSMLLAVGKVMDAEELTFDADGKQPAKTMISLGYARRAWEFTSLSNERDRPSLALPKAQAVVDVLANFGWRDSRQEPRSVRDSDANVRQPAILANGSLGRRVTTLSENSAITGLAVREDVTVDELIEAVFLRVLTREPSAQERELFTGLLLESFEERIIPEEMRAKEVVREPLGQVSWSNHLSPEANSIMLEMEKRASEGDPPTVKLRPEWRERMEDMLWAVLNSPEFLYVP